MTIKRVLAIGMLILTCGWAAWLFGSVNWAGAQKEQVDIGYSADTGLMAVADSLESKEKTIRNYLQEVEKGATTSSAQPHTPATRTRDVFRSERVASGGDEDLETIYLDTSKPQERIKPTFPVERYKFTGVILGPDPRAFILDTVGKKSVSFRINDTLGDGTITSITAGEVVLSGKFGAVKLLRGK